MKIDVIFILFFAISEKAPSKTNVTDLRVQLYKKRQKMQQQQKQAEPEMQEGQPEVDQEYPKTKFREIEPVMMLQQNIFLILHFLHHLFNIIVKIFPPVWSVVSV